MFIHSVYFIPFLLVVLFTYNLLGKRYSYIPLIIFSISFYAFFLAPHLILSLLIATSSSYLIGMKIETCGTDRHKKIYLIAGIIINLSVLIGIKYIPFLLNLINQIGSLFHYKPLTYNFDYIISIGASYYILQAISYITGVYWEVDKPERHFGYFLLYLCFFPKILQGPIERSETLIPQLRKKHDFDLYDFQAGALLFLVGLFKKIVVADRLALYVNPVYDNVANHSGIAYLIATYLYALQIYFDFSGYTDMALGSARTFGIRLTNNFDSPYGASSVAEFWRRWHITFSRWILEYIFTPLQMKFRSMKHLGTPISVLITFSISGLWHGASWCFVVWGLLHGLYLGTSVLLKPVRYKVDMKLKLSDRRWYPYWKKLVTFHLVCLAWIFFRSNSMSDAIYVFKNMFSSSTKVALQFMQQGGYDVALTGTLLASVLIIKQIDKRIDIINYITEKSSIIQWAAIGNISVFIFTFGIYGNTGFIYTRF